MDPEKRPFTVQPDWVDDAPRSGRPTKKTKDLEALLIAMVSKDRAGREKTTSRLAMEISDLSTYGSISPVTVWRMLKGLNFSKVKPTMKPGLSAAQRAARLKWCLDHAHWTLEDWKRVIWTDETSVLMGIRRGSRKLWRRPDEQYKRQCVRNRWKGYSEFMFWGCFTYEKKGPCYVWQPETAAEKKEAATAIAALNEGREQRLREEWELERGVDRLALKTRSGPKPRWRWNKASGKLERRSGSGIDWWRYHKHIVEPLLIPFAKECGEDAIVMEDGAPSHKHAVHAETYSATGIQRLLWCGNSPDLNAIEPCWFWMKRLTTKWGSPQSRPEAMRVWRREWQELAQTRIQAWIERIPHHIQEVIRLEGGNEYKEGRRVRIGAPSTAWAWN